MTENPSDDELRQIYERTKRIAVVGASKDPSKAAHKIPKLLQRNGFEIVPVTPAADEIFGERAYPALPEVPGDIDVVDVFRPADEAPDIAREAVAAGAKVLWLQEGLVSEDAAAIAREGGLQVVMDACMGATLMRLGLNRSS